jgi:hypothetical protein
MFAKVVTSVGVSAVLTFGLSGVPLSVAVPPPSAIPTRASAAPAAPAAVRAERVGDKAVRVSWSKVVGAKSYRVLSWKSGKWRLVKAVSGAKLTVKKLGKGKTHSFRVSACTARRGEGVCGVRSASVSARTYKKKDKKVNAGKVVVARPRVLGLTDTWVLDVGLTPARYGIAKKKKVYDTKLRYANSNPAVASLSASGKLTALSPGLTTVTVTAHNGVRASVSVQVADLTAVVNPVSPQPETRQLIDAHNSRMAQLADYALTARVSRYLHLDDSGKLVLVGGELPDDITRAATQVLSEGLARPVHIQLGPGWVTFFIYLNGIPQGEEGAKYIRLDYNSVDYDKRQWEDGSTFEHWTQTCVGFESEPDEAVDQGYLEEDL